MTLFNVCLLVVVVAHGMRKRSWPFEFNIFKSSDQQTTRACSSEENPIEEMRDYSSVYANQQPGIGHARSRLGSPQAWSARRNDANQYMTIDLGKKMEVYGTVVQGRHDVPSQYVSKYEVVYSNDGSNWTTINGTFYGVRGNIRISNDFQSPVQARYVKLIVKKWVGHISMRAGVIACSASATTAAPTTAAPVTPGTPEVEHNKTHLHHDRDIKASISIVDNHNPGQQVGNTTHLHHDQHIKASIVINAVDHDHGHKAGNNFTVAFV